LDKIRGSSACPNRASRHVPLGLPHRSLGLLTREFCVIASQLTDARARPGSIGPGNARRRGLHGADPMGLRPETVLRLVGGVAGAAVVGGPLGSVLDSLGGDTLGELLKASATPVVNILSNLGTDCFRDAVRGLRVQPNHDIQRALAVAMAKVLE